MPLNHENTKEHKKYLSTTCKELLPEELWVNVKKILEEFLCFSLPSLKQSVGFVQAGVFVAKKP